MKRITEQELREFVKPHRQLTIREQAILNLVGQRKIKKEHKEIREKYFHSTQVA